MTNDNRERILFILRVIALLITIIAAISCSIVLYWTAHTQDSCGAPMPHRGLSLFLRYFIDTPQMFLNVRQVFFIYLYPCPTVILWNTSDCVFLQIIFYTYSPSSALYIRRTDNTARAYSTAPIPNTPHSFHTPVSSVFSLSYTGWKHILLWHISPSVTDKSISCYETDCTTNWNGLFGSIGKTRTALLKLYKSIIMDNEHYFPFVIIEVFWYHMFATFQRSSSNSNIINYNKATWDTKYILYVEVL